jgi:hypothetical protein
MSLENKNPAQPEPELLTAEDQAALLVTEIESDRADLEELVNGIPISPEDEEIVGLLEAEIKEKELLLGFFHQTLQQIDGNTEQASRGVFLSDRDQDEAETSPVKLESIGWLQGEGSKDVEVEKIESGDNTVYFGSIAEENRITRDAAEKLKASGEWDDLLQILKSEKLPMLWMEIQSGSRRIRPVSIGTRNINEVEPDNSMNTTYPAYKIDVHGTNNRALVMITGRKDGVPVFVLAAMYDHDDQQAVLNQLFLKQK